MTHNFNMRTKDMPSEMQVLLADYPRADWDAHAGFRNKTRNWLEAHNMFRNVSEMVRLDAERYLDKDQSGDEFAGRLSYFGGLLVRSLHGHHGWEDHQFFPELEAADPRFATGLELLEQDHHDLDEVLDGLTQSANRAIKLVQLDEAQAYEEAGEVQRVAGVVEAFLDRHLGDEEDLAVPIILHHRLRG